MAPNRQRLHTPLCALLGIDYPILNAPIGTAAGPELAAAVSNAGGLGMIAVSFLDGADAVRQAIRRVRALTDKPFGVNLLLEWPQEERLAACLAEGVALVSLFWGDPAPHVEAIHRAGALLMQSVGGVEEARHAQRAGADVVLAQGWEAGGHVRGEIATMALVPSVVDAVPGLPVVAAGGIADGRGVAAALMLGASGVALGTRFVASSESTVPDMYRDLLVAAGSGDTVFGGTFDIGWPDSNMRTLRNSTMRRWIEAGRPPIGARPGEGDTVARRADGSAIPRYHVTQPAPGLTGELEALALYCGQGVGLIAGVEPAGQIVQGLVREAGALLASARGHLD
ncbi:nitronate monooxygenase [Ramlibacter sp.]|uniref:NAD(P)H-dependent flavin oxidoreductase n=1 Tax=Ramlibacter sp. TaxID=1917967 RepID=UPI00183B1254|nr:nitronate monooxygenase [Ramlibacter sp.]MBA2676035.1 nitronate monooxygenase [Ramlibacter sp.]